MSCFLTAILFAFVDRIEGSWASVEVGLDEHVEVHISRLPGGAGEGDRLCYCQPVRCTSPVIFRMCPDVFLESQKPRSVL